MFKKILLSILVALLSFSIFACGNKPATKATTAESAENDETEVDYLTSKITGLRCASEYPSNTTIDKMDAFKFGNYTQNNTSNEALEWIVLDKQSDKALLISKYTIDCKPYNETSASVNWDNSTLKTWLNNDFKNSVFSSEEKNSILSVIVPSINDMNNYFNDDEARKSTATKYAKDNGCWVSSQFLINGEGTVCYFLSDNGDTMDTAAFVGDSGKIGSWGSRVNLDDCGIRPAIWVKYDGTNAGTLQINSQTTNNSNDNQGSVNSSNDRLKLMIKLYDAIKNKDKYYYSADYDEYSELGLNDSGFTDAKFDNDGNLWLVDVGTMDGKGSGFEIIDKSNSNNNAYYYSYIPMSDGTAGEPEFTKNGQTISKEEYSNAWSKFENTYDNYVSSVNSSKKVTNNSGTNFGLAANSNNLSNSLSSQISRVKCITDYPSETTVDQMDTITFGNYYQSNDNTKEPIEWIVLEKQGDTALIVSKKILNYIKYYDDYYINDWEKSNYRSWLNGEFIQEAFNSEEKKHIKGTIGNDKVGILTRNILKEYFDIYNCKWEDTTEGGYFIPNDSFDVNYFYPFEKQISKLVVESTQYAINNHNNNLIERGIDEEYLKESRMESGQASAFIYYDNDNVPEIISSYSIGHSDGTVDDGRQPGVRPAMWVAYNSQSSNSDSANANNIANLLDDDIHIDGVDIFQNPDGSIQIGGTPQNGTTVVSQNIEKQQLSQDLNNNKNRQQLMQELFEKINNEVELSQGEVELYSAKIGLYIFHDVLSAKFDENGNLWIKMGNNKSHSARGGGSGYFIIDHADSNKNIMYWCFDFGALKFSKCDLNTLRNTNWFVDETGKCSYSTYNEECYEKVRVLWEIEY